MSRILTAERELYQDVWSSVQKYGEHSPGEHYLPLFLQMVGDKLGTVLDAGCGSGKGALALSAAGYKVSMLDVTDAGLVSDARMIHFMRGCLWQPMPMHHFDYVYCCDVLEHIPPQFTMLSIHQMLTACSVGLFLTVSLVPDNFGMWAGKPLHQSVFPFVWWRDSLKEIGDVSEARDMISNAAFFVKPRRFTR